MANFVYVVFKVSQVIYTLNYYFKILKYNQFKKKN